MTASGSSTASAMMVKSGTFSIASSSEFVAVVIEAVGNSVIVTVGLPIVTVTVNPPSLQ